MLASVPLKTESIASIVIKIVTVISLIDNLKYFKFMQFEKWFLNTFKEILKFEIIVFSAASFFACFW